jgi:hypothetical protein
MSMHDRQAAQQERYHDAQASGWWANLPVAYRWQLAARYPGKSEREIFDSRHQTPGDFPHCYYDGPSRCVCRRCLP